MNIQSFCGPLSINFLIYLQQKSKLLKPTFNSRVYFEKFSTDRKTVSFARAHLLQKH